MTEVAAHRRGELLVAGHGGDVHLHSAPVPPVRQRRRHAPRLCNQTFSICHVHLKCDLVCGSW